MYSTTGCLPWRNLMVSLVNLLGWSPGRAFLIIIDQLPEQSKVHTTKCVSCNEDEFHFTGFVAALHVVCHLDVPLQRWRSRSYTQYVTPGRVLLNVYDWNVRICLLRIFRTCSAYFLCTIEATHSLVFRVMRLWSPHLMGVSDMVLRVTASRLS